MPNNAYSMKRASAENKAGVEELEKDTRQLIEKKEAAAQGKG